MVRFLSVLLLICLLIVQQGINGPLGVCGLGNCLLAPVDAETGEVSECPCGVSSAQSNDLPASEQSEHESCPICQIDAYEDDEFILSAFSWSVPAPELAPSPEWMIPASDFGEAHLILDTSASWPPGPHRGRDFSVWLL